jgi:acetylornithine/succinyldiaminopimelate/putrescine aminotransferase/predicted amino acid dehydrogenase
MSVRLNPERERLMQWAGMKRQFVRGEGVWLFDDRGDRFLDAYAQYGALALGHNHPAVKRAIADALQGCVPAMVQPYAATSAAALAYELYRLGGGHFSRCVFTTSGAETVEAAIKLARMRRGRPLIVSALGSYHGKTMGALAASDRLEFSLHHHHRATGFARVPFGDVAALEAFLGEHGRETAGFIVEPIQGERGVFEPPAGYLLAAKELCERTGVAFIADEIQTGLFRTGRAFACDFEGVVPDILLVAKALGGGVFPLGACLVAEHAWDAEFALGHSSTFANNNVACAAGLAVLRELQSRSLQDNLTNTIAHLGRGLAELAQRYPRAVEEVRGKGLMHAIELRKPHERAGCFMTYLHQQGLSGYVFASVLAQKDRVLVLPTLHDDNVVRIAPPLIASCEHIAELLAALDATLRLWDSASSAQIAHTVMQAAAGQRDERNPSLPPVLPSRRPRAADAPIDYAFLVHPTTAGDLVVNDPSLCELTAQEILDYQAYLAQMPPGIVCEVPEIVSRTGARARGVLIAVPLLPEQMIALGRARVCDAIASAVDLAHRRGARLVGLGAFTSVYTRKGTAVTGRGPSITTGNLLTAGMTFEALQHVLGRSMSGCRVGIVGARGSVGALVAQLIARARPSELILAGNPASGIDSLRRTAEMLRGHGCARVTTTRDIAMLERCDVIVSASSAARPVLDDVRIRSGTVVCDVARPFDASAQLRSRRDITVIDGGLVALPGTPRSIGAGNVQGQPPGVALACLSETMLLSLEGAARDHGVGDDLDVSAVDAMLDLAHRHGFTLAPLPHTPQLGKEAA